MPTASSPRLSSDAASERSCTCTPPGCRCVAPPSSSASDTRRPANTWTGSATSTWRWVGQRPRRSICCAARSKTASCPVSIPTRAMSTSAAEEPTRRRIPPIAAPPRAAQVRNPLSPEPGQPRDRAIRRRIRDRVPSAVGRSDDRAVAEHEPGVVVGDRRRPGRQSRVRRRGVGDGPPGAVGQHLVRGDLPDRSDQLAVRRARPEQGADASELLAVLPADDRHGDGDRRPRHPLGDDLRGRRAGDLRRDPPHAARRRRLDRPRRSSTRCTPSSWAARSPSSPPSCATPRPPSTGAQQTALERYSHAVRQHATEAERVQVDAIVHDSVLTTLLSASRGVHPGGPVIGRHDGGATRSATLREAVATAPAAGGSVRMAALANRIADAASTMSQPFTVRTPRDRVGAAAGSGGRGAVLGDRAGHGQQPSARRPRGSRAGPR